MFGPWFEWGIPKEVPEELQLEVDAVIDFLAPYFGLDIKDDEAWDKIGFPRMVIGEPGYLDGIISLKDVADKRSMGHETGHWLHDTVNPEIFAKRESLRTKRLDKFIPLDDLCECVARYAEEIYVNKKDPFGVPPFGGLYKLSRMTAKGAYSNAQKLNDLKYQFIGDSIKRLMHP